MYDGWAAAHSTDFRKSAGISSRHKRIDARHPKVVIYEGFVEGRLDAPEHLVRTLPDLYSGPKHKSNEVFGTGNKPVDAVPKRIQCASEIAPAENP